MVQKKTVVEVVPDSIFFVVWSPKRFFCGQSNTGGPTQNKCNIKHRHSCAMVAAFSQRDVAIGIGCLVFFLLWHGFRALSGVVNICFWSIAGVYSFCRTFADTGHLKPRQAVDDNVRVVRHTSFVVTTLCLGSAAVGTIEALAAYHLEPWWIQLPANAALTLLVSAVGSWVFAFSHQWVLLDPTLDKPLWLLEVCVVS